MRPDAAVSRASSPVGHPPARRGPPAAWALLALLTLLRGAQALARPAGGGDDLREQARALIESGKDGLDAGVEARDRGRVRAARDQLRQAKDLLTKALADPACGEEQAQRLRRDLVDLDVWLKWAEEEAGSAQAPEGGPPAGPAAPQGPVPPLKEGALAGPWVEQLRARYRATASGVERGILAQRMAAEAGLKATAALFALFREEADPKAREGLHDALAAVGTSRVAAEMGRYARRDAAEHWDRALDVICRALEKPEKTEPERPWCRAVRAFHELEERKLTLRLLGRLDAMGPEGVAALGEVIYVEDFGYHDHTIALLSKKRDRRAVPPLVFKLNRFAFEAMEQMPAHQALLKMGWYAVPELIDRLDDKAAGVWISWTLRKITGETMGTDKRKWHDWWKGESVRHPELFDDPEERPPAPTTPGSK